MNVTIDNDAMETAVKAVMALVEKCRMADGDPIQIHQITVINKLADLVVAAANPGVAFFPDNNGKEHRGRGRPHKVKAASEAIGV